MYNNFWIGVKHIQTKNISYGSLSKLPVTPTCGITPKAFLIPFEAIFPGRTVRDINGIDCSFGTFSGYTLS